MVGFDDFRLADMLPTPVTVVASDIAELGRSAARLLLDRAAGTDRRPPQRIVLPCRLDPAWVGGAAAVCWKEKGTLTAPWSGYCR